VALLTQLGSPEPVRFGERFPHEASGRQLQRAMTATALYLSPDVVVFDEPTAAFDADVRERERVLRLIRGALAPQRCSPVTISIRLVASPKSCS